MLIVSQDKKSVVSLEQIGQMYCDSSYDKFTRIYTDFADGRTCELGLYCDEGEAEKAIKEVVDAFEGVKKAEFLGCENETYKSHVFYMPDIRKLKKGEQY